MKHFFKSIKNLGSGLLVCGSLLLPNVSFSQESSDNISLNRVAQAMTDLRLDSGAANRELLDEVNLMAFDLSNGDISSRDWANLIEGMPFDSQLIGMREMAHIAAFIAYMKPYDGETYLGWGHHNADRAPITKVLRRIQFSAGIRVESHIQDPHKIKDLLPVLSEIALYNDLTGTSVSLRHTFGVELLSDILKSKIASDLEFAADQASNCYSLLK